MGDSNKQTNIKLEGDILGTFNLAEQGNITSTNIVNTNNKECKETLKLIEVVKKIVKEELEENDVKEELVDDLDIVSEQLKSGQPKLVKIRKACSGMKKFLIEAPKYISSGTLLVSKLDQLINQVQGLFS
ncbi:hypothetical protein LTX14_000810 [Clostridium perfringens]|uniref:hypothetical protein n=1 Tax=Clostridium perfringens TaxID=1502 RepID=UPI0013E2AD58|nr:hypothetical protein [Clostridium perfringens]MBI6022845.1 hypothetical protein [Clostridium perfringens]MBI6043625.1 hypothetical protein [Clostridium perfringens]MBI6046045.1 hypothetical protein [Clostridium perfringens]MDJ8925860.1 hypothetical protein [Clostridium perfringens]MDJ8928703.1 hypothetical protein [Clostridium perfringens]